MNHVINICGICDRQTDSEYAMRSTWCMIHLVTGNYLVFYTHIKEPYSFCRLLHFADKQILNRKLVIFVPSDFKAFGLLDAISQI